MSKKYSELIVDWKKERIEVYLEYKERCSGGEDPTKVVMDMANRREVTYSAIYNKITRGRQEYAPQITQG